MMVRVGIPAGHEILRRELSDGGKLSEAAIGSLRTIKNKYDPGNLFRLNAHVVPAA